jgi:hypothetical protein
MLLFKLLLGWRLVRVVSLELPNSLLALSNWLLTIIKDH